MTPAMIAALSANRKSVTGFFEFDLPSGTRRILIGSGEVAWGANTFKGYDSTFGSIADGDSIAEDVSGQAPNTSITVQVASTAEKSDLAGADVQLSPAKIWLAAITQDANHHFVAVADPEPVFDGFIDQATINLDRQRNELDYTLISGFDYFFEDSEGQRLSDAFHETVWPGEKGLVNVTGVTKKVYWGTLGPNAAAGVTSGGSYSSSYGPNACVTIDSFILMADGRERRAGAIEPGDRVWTRHEHSGELGDFEVTAVRFVEGESVMAFAGWPDATPNHRFCAGEAVPLNWFLMREVGKAAGEATVAKITVADAHTYLARHPASDEWRLCHNVKPLTL